MVSLSLFVILFVLGLFALTMSLLKVIEEREKVETIYHQIERDTKALEADYSHAPLGFSRSN